MDKREVKTTNRMRSAVFLHFQFSVMQLQRWINEYQPLTTRVSHVCAPSNNLNRQNCLMSVLVLIYSAILTVKRWQGCAEYSEMCCRGSKHGSLTHVMWRVGHQHSPPLCVMLMNHKQPVLSERGVELLPPPGQLKQQQREGLSQ